LSRQQGGRIYRDADWAYSYIQIGFVLPNFYNKEVHGNLCVPLRGIIALYHIFKNKIKMEGEYRCFEIFNHL
jgi:hypothetical protein